MTFKRVLVSKLDSDGITRLIQSDWYKMNLTGHIDEALINNPHLNEEHLMYLAEHCCSWFLDHMPHKLTKQQFITACSRGRYGENKELEVVALYGRYSGWQRLRDE